jgi:hypothetical protein
VEAVVAKPAANLDLLLVLVVYMAVELVVKEPR